MQMALGRVKFLSVDVDGHIDPEKLQAEFSAVLDSLLPAFHQHIREQKAAGENCAEFSKKVVKLSFLTGRDFPNDITDRETLEKVMEEFEKGDVQI